MNTKSRLLCREFETLYAAKSEDAKILAGGTDLMVLIKEKLLAPRLLIDISDLNELRGISFDPRQGLTIMAGTKVAEIERSTLVKEHAPALAYAAANLGSNQVRWMATMAGNVCHASPAAETPPVLLAHDCELIIGRKGENVPSRSAVFSWPTVKPRWSRANT